MWAEDAFWFSTGAGEQKFANLEANPHVALTTGSTAGTTALTSWWKASRSRSPTTRCSPGSPAVFAAHWDGRWQWIVRGGCFRFRDGGGEGAMVFSVTPVKVFAHAKGDPFGATPHRFCRARGPAAPSARALTARWTAA